MEHLENDMDDLFQKAGDLYPLKINEPDWDAMLGKFNAESIGITGLSANRANNNNQLRRWLWLLLLIPFSIGGMFYFSHKNKGIVDTSLKSQNIHSGSDQSIKHLNAKSGSFAESARPAESSPQKEFIEGSKNRNVLFSKNKNDQKNNFYGDNIKDVDDSYSFKTPPLHEPLKKPMLIQVSGFSSFISVYGKPLMQNSLAASMPVTTDSVFPKAKQKSAIKGFSITVLGGLDYSSVNFQSIKQTGYSLGFLAGYRFNKHFSFETGLLWDKKYYYTEGSYYKSKKPLPSNVKIQDIDGNCDMIEIPVGLKYQIGTGKNHGFFVKTGLNAYFMKKEYYNFSGENYYMGSMSSFTKDSVYKNATKSLFSILQLSAGYEYAIGARTKIRVEPYLKIPLSGIGFGSLPIASAGIYFGFTYSFR